MSDAPVPSPEPPPDGGEGVPDGGPGTVPDTVPPVTSTGSLPQQPDPVLPRPGAQESTQEEIDEYRPVNTGSSQNRTPPRYIPDGPGMSDPGPMV